MKQDALEILQSGIAALDLQLSSGQLAQLDLYAEELKKWNKKINLTAITADHDIAIKHFVDSLALARFIKEDSALLDIGSGAGFPCIPLKIALPNLRVTSIDAVEKKILFQRNVARLLGFTEFRAIHGRAELLKESEEQRFDVVVSRAFSELGSFLSMAGPVVKGDGTIIAMKGKDGKEEAMGTEGFIEQAGFYIQRVEEFPLPHSGDQRSLIFLAKK